MKDLETVHLPTQFLVCDQTEASEEFLRELSESIKAQGLLNPISVQPLNSVDGNPRFKVVAGKKRLMACTMIGATSVPCRIVDGDDTTMTLIAIEENLRRKNLPWWEISALVKDWHDTRQAQHGVSEAKKGKANRETPGWSMRDTAEELRMSLGFISEAVMVAKAVERDPTLRNIADRETAIRLVRGAARRIEAEVMASAPVDFQVNQVYCGPAAEILKRFERGIFDVCLTDPPWLKYIDEKLTRDDETLPVFKELYRVMKTNSFLYMFVGFEDFYSYSRRLLEYGFVVSKTPLLWIKKELRVVDDKAYLHGMVLSKGARSWEYSRDFELILLAVKGSPALVQSIQESSIKIYPPLPPVTLTHPNEKPVPLIMNLLEDCSHEGSIILDPFAGSGAHIEACERLKRRWIAIERDHESYEKIRERMRKVRNAT